MKPQKFVKKLYKKITWEQIDKNYLLNLAKIARDEDMFGLGLKDLSFEKGDFSSKVVDTNDDFRANFVAREDMVVCGLEFIPIILEAYQVKNVDYKIQIKDGSFVREGEILATVSGEAQGILKAERVMLNFVQKLSGIATQTHKYVLAMGKTKTKLLDTRKTTPAFRILEKYAVACGGANNHRMGLFDMVMLKDNHLSASNAQSESLTALVEKARKQNPELPIEVEVDNLWQLPFVIKAKPDVIMLDNFSCEDIVSAVRLVGETCYTEISGNVNIKTLPILSKLEADFISSGSLVHKAIWKDIGLDCF